MGTSAYSRDTCYSLCAVPEPEQAAAGLAPQCGDCIVWGSDIILGVDGTRYTHMSDGFIYATGLWNASSTWGIAVIDVESQQLVYNSPITWNGERPHLNLSYHLVPFGGTKDRRIVLV